MSAEQLKNTVDVDDDEKKKPKPFVPTVKGKKVSYKKQKRKREYRWPDYVEYDGNNVWVCEKNPNFALYLLPSSQMNRKLVLSKEKLLGFLKHSKNSPPTWEALNKKYVSDV